MNKTYFVETCFYPNGDRNMDQMCDRSQQRVFGDLESARIFAREWADEDSTHESIIWQEVESTACSVVHENAKG